MFESLFRARFASRFRRFQRALERPADAQERVRQQITAAMARAEYGKAHAIRGCEPYNAFSRKLPVVSYEEICPWIERQAATRDHILVDDSILVYERTSGSSASQKLIPYTKKLLDTFNQCFILWAYDLVSHGPPFRTGKIFMSISPPFHDPSCTSSGVPIGLADDTEYLSPVLRRSLGSCLVMPPGIKHVRDPDQYKRVLAAALVAEGDLEILSVWSPTYLTVLLDFVIEHRELIQTDLERGGVIVGGKAFTYGSVAEERLALLRSSPIPWQELWPELKLLSCWTDAGAARFARRLTREFPDVLLQGKGLLATEGPITLPLVASPTPVPFVDLVFLEFESEDGIVRRLHELVDDREYEVIITQGGGLVRYRLHDRVVVAGRFKNTPCLRFVGRSNAVSDLVGEKLCERFVREVVERVFPGENTFAFLVPVRLDDRPPHYACLTSDAGPDPVAAARRLESELVRAFHYRLARLLGQLDPVRVVVCPDARERYCRHFMHEGMKWGDIKYAAVVGKVDQGGLARLTDASPVEALLC